MQITRYKRRKVKKRWVSVAVATLASASLLLVGGSAVSADTSVPVTDQTAVISEQQVQDPLDEGAVGSAENTVPTEVATASSEVSQDGTQNDSHSTDLEAVSVSPSVTDASQNDIQADSYKEHVSTVTPSASRPASSGTIVSVDSGQEPLTTTAQFTTSEIPEEKALKGQDFVSDDERATIGKIVDGRSSGISSLDAAALTSEFEKARLKGATDATVLKEVQNSGKVIPSNLTYLSDFYDDQTGTSGTAFKDQVSDKVIIAYTGTNRESNDLQDTLGADIMGIGLARGQHYQPAYDFYDKIVGQYGAAHVVITGHSLGGNLAQRVALKKNHSETVVYNAAPLYIPAVAYLGNKVYDSLRKDFDLPSNKEEAKETIADIKNDMKQFTGHVIRITTQKDWLNNMSRLLGAVNLGEEHIISNSGNHDLQGIANDEKQVASVKEFVSL